MKRDEHKQIINQLLGMVTPDKQATASEMLANLSEDYEQVLTANESANSRVEELTANNETLRSVNAKLFLKVGEIPKGEPATEPKEEPEIPTISIDSLFNDKGELI